MFRKKFKGDISELSLDQIIALRNEKIKIRDLLPKATCEWNIENNIIKAINQEILKKMLDEVLYQITHLND